MAGKVAAECAYFARPTARGFERPYGWAWLLKLAAELTAHDDRWSRALAPLAEVIAQRFRDFLPIATYPVRVGTHFNTAFGLRMAADYERVALDTTMVFTSFFGQLAPFPDALRPQLRELGMAGKILLGSDFPNIPYPYATQIAALARLGLGEDWLRAVCWESPVGLFGLAETAGLG